MTDKRWVRTLSGAKLEALIGQSPMSALAEKEIARLYEEGSKWATEELCLALLKLDANSAVAKDYMKRLHPEDEKEKQKGAGKGEDEAKKQ